VTSPHPDPSVLERLAELPPERRRQATEHVASCAECRSTLAAGDPSRMFTLLADRPIPETVLDQVSGSVMEAIRLEQGRPPVRGRAEWLRAGALAAGLALAALLGVRLAGPVDGPIASVAPGEGAPAPVASPRLGLELHGNDDSVEVFDLTVGETQVVMIFDERLEL
jgi:anti-sigma factor RsiW